MQKITLKDLDKKKKEFQPKQSNWVKVGMSTCGIAAGAQKTYQIFLEEIKKKSLAVSVEKCGCAGMCFAEPLVEVFVEGLPKVIYGGVDQETAKKIVERHICGKRLVNDHIYSIKEG